MERNKTVVVIHARSWEYRCKLFVLMAPKRDAEGTHEESAWGEDYVIHSYMGFMCFLHKKHRVNLCFKGLWWNWMFYFSPAHFISELHLLWVQWFFFFLNVSFIVQLSLDSETFQTITPHSCATSIFCSCGSALGPAVSHHCVSWMTCFEYLCWNVKY